MQLITNDIGEGRRSGGIRYWSCPFHDDASPSLSVTRDNCRWKCFGCGEHGDAIDWLRKRQGLTFPEAVAKLGGELDRRKPRQQPKPAIARLAAPQQPPSGDWQAKAFQIVEQAADRLWTPEGADALEWLRQRGLADETIYEARLGFSRGEQTGGLYCERGITIPWYATAGIVFVQVRRLAADKPKYKALAGGTRGGMYPGTPSSGRPLLIVEGEFDALLAQQETGDLVAVATLGGAADALNTDAALAVVCAPVVLVATDNDKAGDEAWRRWQAVTARAKRITPLGGKDITDTYLAGADLRSWIGGELGRLIDDSTSTTPGIVTLPVNPTDDETSEELADTEECEQDAETEGNCDLEGMELGSDGWPLDSVEPVPCPTCSGLTAWWTVAGERRCQHCQPPRYPVTKLAELQELAEMLRKRADRRNAKKNTGRKPQQ
jgi:hypothetical protein